MSDNRKIRFQGKDLGSHSIRALDRMATRGEINHTAEFWSETEQAWCPLAGIIFDFSPPRLDDMRSAGITKVRILGSGSEDCPACAALQEIVYAIEEVPKLPLAACTCVPWCRCVEIAVA
jgi:hypothetical protein